MELNVGYDKDILQRNRSQRKSGKTQYAIDDCNGIIIMSP